jgi:hypothetical protein
MGYKIHRRHTQEIIAGKPGRRISAMGDKSPKKEVKAPKKDIKEKRKEKQEKQSGKGLKYSPNA